MNEAYAPYILNGSLRVHNLNKSKYFSITASEVGVYFEIQMMGGIKGNFDGQKVAKYCIERPTECPIKERKKERILRLRSPIFLSGTHLALFLSEKNGAHFYQLIHHFSDYFLI